MDELRVLDAKVSDILGHKVIGWETCVYADGCWAIVFGSPSEGWACHAECGPIFQEFTHHVYDEEMDRSDDAKAFYEKYGISISGCSVVPTYSKDANEALRAWELFIEKVPESYKYSLRIELKQERWTCSAYCVGANFYHLVASAEKDTLPLALSNLIVEANNVIQGLSNDSK